MYIVIAVLKILNNFKNTEQQEHEDIDIFGEWLGSHSCHIRLIYLFSQTCSCFKQ